MASKKITKAPSGVSFTHTPAEPYGPLTHDWPRVKHTCGGTIRVAGKQDSRDANRPDALIYVCTGCDWISPDGFEHDPTPKTFHHVATDTILSQPSKVQTPEFIKAFRKENIRQMKLQKAEREKFPPSLLKKGRYTKGARKGEIRWVNNPRFTDAMREHMGTFAIDSEQIAAEIVSSGVRRFKAPQKKVKS